MGFLKVKAWGKPGEGGHQENARFSDDAGRWGAIHSSALGIQGVRTTAGSVHNDID
jgi:hypothetical protein